MSESKGEILTLQTSGSRQAVTEILVSYVYMVQWVVLSAGLIMFNKYLLAFYGFPFPISLTMMHMAFGSVAAFVLVKIGVAKQVDMDLKTYMTGIVPMGILFSLVLWLSNGTYVYLSVSFAQMLKAISPVSVYVIGVVFGNESIGISRSINMVIVAVGIAVAVFGEIDFVPIGVIMQLIAIVLESVRLNLLQMLLQSKGIKLNPITTMYYVAPCCLLCLTGPFVLLEYKAIIGARESIDFSFPLFLGNCVVAFLLNLSSFMLIGKTSALNMNVAGVIKDWLLILLSVYIYHSKITHINLGGYALAFSGVCWYNYTRIKDKLKAENSEKIEQSRSK
eukprot:TRINITY_DN21673_c0_g1_i1.p1 TRINITY_DN21673_c0_g1~~TRINITY_DN21673_c0_g1_i1.p1  ORF type:complete len:371 (-),score=15.74 TRINITY_DN21673_c0_g1_i1:229-1233(-)